MAAKGWLIGCGSVLVVVILIAVIGGGFVVQRMGAVRQDLSDAQQRYTDVNREFPFTPPSSGELNVDRFEKYLKVRAVVDSAMIPAAPFVRRSEA